MTCFSRLGQMQCLSLPSILAPDTPSTLSTQHPQHPHVRQLTVPGTTTSIRHPASAPGTQDLALSTWHPPPAPTTSTRHPAYSTKHQAPSTKHPAPAPGTMH
ncbi:hypothetical protein B484DRAFT_446906 [Ochromonadaceae sp. CCMP2298]|nr:hypothetical protein B484DRAFT_446906 [Ochromonadaceae sp. CCMP2298]